MSFAGRRGNSRRDHASKDAQTDHWVVGSIGDAGNAMGPLSRPFLSVV